MSLPSPLIATETRQLSKIPGPQSVKLSAGLHRQIWVSGNSIFVDIHVVNKASRCLKKVEVQLQRSFLWYDHAAAGTGEKNANHLRIHKRQDAEIVSNTEMKKSNDWKGILPNSSEVRTCQLNVPRGQVTVSTGRFFEVRYFLNVIVAVATFKTVSVQLPVTLVHMNSLDIVPNALAQVAASIEAKRSRTLPLHTQHGLYLPYHQGQAFIAPQRQSLEKARSVQGGMAKPDLQDLRGALDGRPHGQQQQHQHHCYDSGAFNTTDQPGRSSTTISQKCHHKYDSGCYHCHLVHENQPRPSTSHSRAGGNLPRLRVSTSGLGFTDTEFSFQDSPPRKVMLSEQERRLINQQRELEKRSERDNVQRQGSKSSRMNAAQRTVVSQATLGEDVTVRLDKQIRRAEPHVMERAGLRRKRSKTLEGPSQVHAQVMLTEDQQKVVDLPVVLQPRTSNTNLIALRDTRRRANTGPDVVSKPKAHVGADHLHKGVTFPQDPIGFQRMSSKRRGKLPADGFVFPHKASREMQHKARV